MFMPTHLPPSVPATDQCNVFEADGTRCAHKTGNTEAGIDADLCSEHRAAMAKQRRDATKAAKDAEGRQV